MLAFRENTIKKTRPFGRDGLQLTALSGGSIFPAAAARADAISEGWRSSAADVDPTRRCQLLSPDSIVNCPHECGD
jgi:hypothetical protein